MNIQLIQALTLLAWNNYLASEQAPAKLVPILEATSKAADEAARHIQYGRLDQLTPQQRKMVDELSNPS